MLSYDMIGPEGQSILLAWKLLGYDLSKRVSGIDLIKELIEVPD